MKFDFIQHGAIEKRDSFTIKLIFIMALKKEFTKKEIFFIKAVNNFVFLSSDPVSMLSFIILDYISCSMWKTITSIISCQRQQ